MMDWSGNGGWMNGYGMWLMLGFWGVVVVLVVWAVIRMTGHSAVHTSLESPRQILDRRFAAGELNAEQYSEARRVLDGRGTTSAPS